MIDMCGIFWNAVSFFAEQQVRNAAQTGRVQETWFPDLNKYNSIRRNCQMANKYCYLFSEGNANMRDCLLYTSPEPTRR